MSINRIAILVVLLGVACNDPQSLFDFDAIGGGDDVADGAGSGDDVDPSDAVAAGDSDSDTAGSDVTPSVDTAQGDDGETSVEPASCERHTDCRGGELCREGRCRTIEERVCEPGARRCDGDTVRICDAGGTRESTIRCAMLPDCAESSLGCTCDAGECVLLTCDPTFVRCDDNVLETCDADSGEPVRRDCEAEGLRCAAAVGDCVDSLCEPGDQFCSPSATAVLRCDETGVSVDRTDCGSGTYCRLGECVPQVCEPGSRRCIDGDVYRCTESGGDAVLDERCAADATCDEGVCVGATPECEAAIDCPPPRGRCEGETLVTYSGNGACTRGRCNYDGAIRRTDCGGAGRVCSVSSLACVLPEGAPCSGDGDCPGGYCQSTVCVSCRSTADCDGANDVCVDGECVPCSCPTGQFCDASGGCIDGDPLNCTTDRQCQDLAEAMGASPTNVACDGVVGCFVRGVCGGSAGSSTRVDPFNAACRSGTSCEIVVDLFGSEIYSACKHCSMTGTSGCRDSEVCRGPGLLDSGNVCGVSSGGGFPFP